MGRMVQSPIVKGVMTRWGVPDEIEFRLSLLL